MNMSIFGVIKKAYLLQVTCVLAKLSICHCKTLEAIINVYTETSYTDYLQASIYDTNYDQFKYGFADKKTRSVILHYDYEFENDWTHYNISSIDRQNTHQISMNAYFRCYVLPSQALIKCNRTIQCISVHLCPNGFGIFWNNGGEYLASEHLQNHTVNCSDVVKLTCYSLVNIPTPRTVRATYKTSNKQVNTDKTTTKIHTYESTTKMVSTTLYTVSTTNSSFTTTMFSTNYSTQKTSSDSTSVIVGVPVGVVIIVVIVCVVIVIYMKSKRKKQSDSSGQIHQSIIQLTERPFNGSDYNHNKSTGSTITDNEQYAVYTINHTNNYTTINRDNITCNNQSHHLQGSDNADIEEDESVTLRDKIVLSDKEKGYYNTICDNQEDIDLRQEYAEDDYSTIEESSSVQSVVHQVSPQTEHSTADKTFGYNNFKEILENKPYIDLHEYNNIKQYNATIKRNEPVKNVYSKLGYNNRNFEHPYGDVGVSLHTVEENSSIQPDNVYFILENEVNVN